jgi:hypothetical protein
VEVLVPNFQRLQSKSSRGSGLDVLEVPARKMSRFHSRSSSGSVMKVLEVLVQKFWITSTDSRSEFFALHNLLSSTYPYLI